MAAVIFFTLIYIVCGIWRPTVASYYKECAADQAGEVINGRIECMFTGCRLKCNSGYKLQGKRKIYLTCNQETGQFMHDGQPWRQSAPSCVPNCKKGCQNGGTCIAPSQCQCNLGYKGKYCEVKECPEPSFPDAQASFTRTDDELHVECHEGYVLPPGTVLGGVTLCRDGAWDLPDDFRCQPTCIDGCQNGGTCIAPSQCQCSPGYKGKNCETRECPEPSFPDAQATFARTDDDGLRVECHEGYVLPPGTTSGGVASCKDGAWDLPVDFRCQPNCINGCQNGGTCIAPSQCQCSPGYKGKNCEERECPEPSFPDAQATFARTDDDGLRVECHEGYVLPPGTAPGGVALCKDGAWDLPDDFRCQPNCINGCQNGGTCIAPSHCQCSPGYKGKNCEARECPEPSFPDAQATFARTDDDGLRVECHEGYVLPPGTAPGGVALCKDGAWDLPDDFRCQPNCIKGCQNGGTCIAPSQCQCSPGYMGKNCEARECPEPSFPDAQASFNRTDNELQVKCHEGYVLPSGTVPGGVAPCKDGAWDIPDHFRCQPTCVNGCENEGTCIAPNQCQCSPGYKGKNCEERECPEPSFPDAQATFARTDDDGLRVECHEGYVLPPGTAPGGVALCKDGAWDLPDDFRCQLKASYEHDYDCYSNTLPRLLHIKMTDTVKKTIIQVSFCHSAICVNGCQNGGTCIAPSQCQCSPGYKGKNCEERECPEPSFPDAQATFARTDDDGLRVECHEGYVLPPGTAPGGVALCKDGAWDLPDEFRCQSNCIKGCQNGGTCIAPSQCQCSPGYMGKNCEARECPEPSFPDAQASFNRTDNELQVKCHEGYVLPSGTVPGGVALCRDGAWDLPDDFRCQPNCLNGCQNGGTCIAPSQCQCSPGYKGKNCEARECPEPSFPDAQATFTRTDDDGLRVECHEGYVLPSGTASGEVALCKDGAWDLPDDFRCRPSCGRPGCQNGGRCVAPNQCQCEDQFTGEHCQVRRCEEPQVRAISANLTVNETHLTAECEPGHAFPHGGTVATLHCQDGEWHSEERVVAANSTLECTPQETPCYYPSKTFNNTIMEGDLFSHSLRCPRGFRMKDGRDGVALVCLEAEWIVRGEGPMADIDLNCYPV
ncbi:multiple epidermal growth factor-like domains protein 10 [Penaeus indicus]|uniref:multiple epidermal growth factor-like domains protein 10 n=1 Tax=Penaeus indicus TaxID=29960 RepID=UPI00300D3B4A